MPVSSYFVSVAFGNNTFVAVSQGSPTSTTAATSTNGITWTLSTLPAAATWRKVSFGNNIFVAVASYITSAATSTNGITWTLSTLPTAAGWFESAFGSIDSLGLRNYIVYNNTIDGNTTITLKSGFALTNPNVIKVSSTNGTSTFTTFGSEIS
jgi:hypothetical protein